MKYFKSEVDPDFRHYISEVRESHNLDDAVSERKDGCRYVQLQLYVGTRALVIEQELTADQFKSSVLNPTQLRRVLRNDCFDILLESLGDHLEEHVNNLILVEEFRG